MEVQTMKTTILTMSAVLVLAGSLAAQSTQLSSEVFSWNGELVALDGTARLLTVKAPVVYEQAPAELQRTKAGERVLLTWSGYDKYADAIREVHAAGVSKFSDRFTFPADFVSYDAEHRYVTFKLQVPESSVAGLKTLKPGEWVTATSPHGVSAKSTPVTMVRPYVDHATALNSN
jgi:hypothetical protein